MVGLLLLLRPDDITDCHNTATQDRTASLNGENSSSEYEVISGSNTDMTNGRQLCQYSDQPAGWTAWVRYSWRAGNYLLSTSRPTVGPPVQRCRATEDWGRSIKIFQFSVTTLSIQIVVQEASLTILSTNFICTFKARCSIKHWGILKLCTSMHRPCLCNKSNTNCWHNHFIVN
jgi:hypothetical protein